MAKALIICAAGMSSSLMAKKTTEYLQGQGQDITVEAIGATEGNKVIESAAFDLYLISPQTVVQIPPQAYVPIPTGVAALAKVVTDNL